MSNMPMLQGARALRRLSSIQHHLTGGIAPLTVQPGRLASGQRRTASTWQQAQARGHSAARAASAVGTAGMTSSAAIMAAAAESPLQVERVPCLKDNYAWILRDAASGKVAVVDPSEAAPVAAALKEWGWKLDYILNTHHHWDHTGGNMELKKSTGCTIVGPKADKDRIPGIDVALADGDVWKFGEQEMQVFDTPGHTRGHITLYFPQGQSLFPGDTLFALGCGRLFEGDARTMWASLSKMTPLPRDTRVFCAHEYTQSNAKFAVTVDPDNTKLAERKKAIDDARAKGEATIPSLLGEELDTNPFLRAPDPAIRRTLGVPDSAADWQAFAAVRTAKDNF